jgi:signal transduction histidine kinase
VEDQLPFESELIARIGWLIRLRWVAVAGVLLVIILSAIWLPGSLPFAALLAVAVSIALYNLGFALHLRSLKRDSAGNQPLPRATRSAHAQIVLDMVALGVLLYLSGGLTNPMALFYVFHVIVASILLKPSTSYLMAGLAVLLLGCLAVMGYVDALGHPGLFPLDARLGSSPYYLAALMLGMALTLFLVVYLTTSIMERLRERDRELFESNFTCQLRSEDLEELNSRLRSIDAERTRFMVLVTHELRAPVNTIFSALDLALEGYASHEKTTEVLTRAKDRATELLELISDLLDLTQVREEVPEPDEVASVQVEDVLRSVVDFVQVEAEARNISLDVQIMPGMAPVHVLPDHIKLVWTNLLSNAIKYGNEGGSVNVVLSQDDRVVTGQVQDTGIGIAPKDIPHVFDEFFRASNARQVSTHGTGVGLAIVKRTIENWGGSIWVESEQEKGTRFTFELPRADL